MWTSINLNQEPVLKKKGTYKIEKDILTLTSSKIFTAEGEKDIKEITKGTFDIENNKFVFGEGTTFRGGNKETLIGKWKTIYSIGKEETGYSIVESEFNLKKDSTFEFSLYINNVKDVLEFDMMGNWVKNGDYITLSEVEIRQAGSGGTYMYPPDGDYPYLIVNETLIFNIAIGTKDIETLKQFNIFNKEG